MKSEYTIFYGICPDNKALELSRIVILLLTQKITENIVLLVYQYSDELFQITQGIFNLGSICCDSEPCY